MGETAPKQTITHIQHITHIEVCFSE
jgi:hypothetical protein